MGTRNITIVRRKNKVKIAQYGHWDGYLSGQGKIVADFIKLIKNPESFEIFCNHVDEVEFNGEEDKYINEAANILFIVYKEPVKDLVNSYDFINNELFCEYAYDIDLDNKTVTVNSYVYNFEEYINFINAVINE